MRRFWRPRRADEKVQRRNHSTEFRAKVALAAFRGDRTFAELTERLDVHPNQITQREMELLERSAEMVRTAAERRETIAPGIGQ